MFVKLTNVGDFASPNSVAYVHPDSISRIFIPTDEYMPEGASCIVILNAGADEMNVAVAESYEEVKILVRRALTERKNL